MNFIRDTNVGGRLGEALGQGLQLLAQGKLQQMQQQGTRARTFQALRSLNAPTEEAYAISSLPEKLQEKLLPKYLEGLASREEPSMEQPIQPTSGLEQGLASLQGRSQAAPVGEIPSTKPEANIMPGQGLQTPQQNVQDFLKQLGIGRGPDILNTLAQRPQPQQAQQAPEAAQPEPTAAPQAEEQTKVTPTAAPTPKKRVKAIPFKEQLAREKSSAEYRANLLERYNAARSTKADIGRMEVLNREGKLPDNQFYSIMKEAGYDFLALMNATDAQEFEKIQQNFLKNMKSIFGGRISIQEMEQYIKGIPSLMMTPEGRERVFRNFRIMADISEEQFKVMRQIVKESGGKVPLGTDLAEQVAERMRDYEDKKYEEFRVGMQRPNLKAGDVIDIRKVPAYTVPGLKATQFGKKWISDGAQWKER